MTSVPDSWQKSPIRGRLAGHEPIVRGSAGREVRRRAVLQRGAWRHRIDREEHRVLKHNAILEMLAGGDRRSIGHSDRVVAIVGRDRRRFAHLIAGLWSDNVLIRMRSADAAEKITRNHPEWLEPYRGELLGLLAEAEEQELRWHLAAMVPRLPLNARERQQTVAALNRYLEDRSSIVKTCALQGLADLARNAPNLRATVIETLREATRSGTAAMKARSRKLLAQLADI